MRMRIPTSRGGLNLRLSVFDAIWAFSSPLLALFFRDAYVLSYENMLLAVLYCLFSGCFSIVAFLAFRLRDGMARYFSVHDALDILKAVVSSQLMTCLVLFTFTRLEGIPRSTPIIHAFLLAAGLIAARAIARALDNTDKSSLIGFNVASENIIMIGATNLSSLFIKLLEACTPNRGRVIAILDDRTKFIGRSMAGVRILAATDNVESVVNEFVEHGIKTNRIIVGGEVDLLSEQRLKEIQRVCEHHEITLDFVPRLIGDGELHQVRIEPSHEHQRALTPNFELPRYFTFKPFVDFFLAMAMIVILVPLLILTAALVLIDVGSPLLFWQQRIGQGGSRFLLHKFRTLRAPFDWRGDPVPEQKRLSAIGHFLRQSRLDELPQLLNVLVGDMSLIGPRPLLPEDQPTNPTTRLLVRPGMTGWAQIHGGKLLTPEAKDELDEYYIRNASLWLDLRIVFMTPNVLFGRKVHSDHEVAAASRVGFGKVPRSANKSHGAVVNIPAPHRTTESPPLASDPSPESLPSFPKRKTPNPST